MVLRGFLGVGLAFVLLLLAPGGALGCSCAVEENPKAQARAVLGWSDAAFIGSLVSVREIEGGSPFEQAIFRYRVRSSYEKDLGRFVRVRASTLGASCGLGRQKGRKIALGLSGRPGRWSSGLCSYIQPKALRAVADETTIGNRRTRCE